MYEEFLRGAEYIAIGFHGIYFLFAWCIGVKVPAQTYLAFAGLVAFAYVAHNF